MDEYDNGLTRFAFFLSDEGGVFKAKGGQRATRGAREVDEGQDTQVELPIDQVEAEEVEVRMRK